VLSKPSTAEALLTSVRRFVGQDPPTAADFPSE
jgi:hypothetical protein